MTDMEPGQAAYEAYAAVLGFTPKWHKQGGEGEAAWAAAERASVAAYINANDCGPVDARSVILEAAGLPVVTAGRLGAALMGRRSLVHDPDAERAAGGDGLWLVLAARPHDLAVQLLSAIDPRLTDDAPQPAGRLPCSACEDEAVTSPHGVPS
jgi:hypothetical protein